MALWRNHPKKAKGMKTIFQSGAQRKSEKELTKLDGSMEKPPKNVERVKTRLELGVQPT